MCIGDHVYLSARQRLERPLRQFGLVHAVSLPHQAAHAGQPALLLSLLHGLSADNAQLLRPHHCRRAQNSQGLLINFYLFLKPFANGCTPKKCIHWKKPSKIYSKKNCFVFGVSEILIYFC